MTDLLNIAKECGARENVTGINDEVLVMTPDQLQATVEQVCKPAILVLEALEWNDWAYDKGGDGYAKCPVCSNAQHGTNCSNEDTGHADDCELNNALTSYRQLIGHDK